MTSAAPSTTPGLTAGRPSTPPEADRDLLSRIGWDLSPFDTRAHAVDPLDQQLTGVHVALCGAKMLAGQLHPLPHGGLCVDCTQRVAASHTANPRWARLPGDVRCHVLGPPSGDPRWQGCRCGARTHPNGLQILDGGPQGLLCTRCVLPDRTDGAR
ncbi:MAG TPA: hypothetical protein VFQ77_14160 [Pseudonocardiaceae bacterium]|jgi:hypothetical protein|nr:hypothetical protein [Pseudonocardiaceae bacterium]